MSATTVVILPPTIRRMADTLWSRLAPFVGGENVKSAELGRALGMSQQAADKVKAGGGLSVDKHLAMSKKFGLNPWWLQSGEGPKFLKDLPRASKPSEQPAAPHQIEQAYDVVSAALHAIGEVKTRVVLDATAIHAKNPAGEPGARDAALSLLLGGSDKSGGAREVTSPLKPTGTGP